MDVFFNVDVRGRSWTFVDVRGRSWTFVDTRGYVRIHTDADTDTDTVPPFPPPHCFPFSPLSLPPAAISVFLYQKLSKILRWLKRGITDSASLFPPSPRHPVQTLQPKKGVLICECPAIPPHNHPTAFTIATRTHFDCRAGTLWLPPCGSPPGGRMLDTTHNNHCGYSNLHRD